MQISRSLLLQAIGAVVALPSAALANIQDEKRAFIAQCDETISIARLCGAPHKFVGKKVDLHGVVGPPAEDPNEFNLNGADEGGLLVVVLGNGKDLEAGQPLRVIGTVEKPITAANTLGGSGTYPVVRARFMS